MHLRILFDYDSEGSDVIKRLFDALHLFFTVGGNL